MDTLEPVEGRVRRYILDSSDQDLRRLVSVSEVSADMARAALRRVGIQEGWSAVECGCGPIGGLAVMAEMVGPNGRVVGVDFNEPAVQQARAVASALGLSNVEVVAGDINELDPATLGSRFDLAYTRLFLMHQANPIQTLRQIWELLRPGGWLIAQEALRTPPPRSHPDLKALDDYWGLLHKLLDRAGVPYGAVEDLPRSACEAGFEICGTSGYSMMLDAELGFELHASTLAAARDRAIRSGIASENQIDDLVLSLRTAKGGEHAWVSGPFFLDLTLRKPMTLSDSGE